MERRNKTRAGRTGSHRALALSLTLTPTLTTLTTLTLTPTLLVVMSAGKFEVTATTAMTLPYGMREEGWKCLSRESLSPPQQSDCNHPIRGLVRLGSLPFCLLIDDGGS